VSASENEEDGIRVAILERLPEPTYEYLCSELNFGSKGWSNEFLIKIFWSIQRHGIQHEHENIKENLRREKVGVR
jgi:hypothetical protein